MKFRTETEPLKLQGTVTHGTPLFLMGSCFTDHVGNRLDAELFEVMANPFGTVYNPASMNAIMGRIVHRNYFYADELIYHEGRFHSYLCHSSMSASTSEETLQRLNAALECANSFLKRTRCVIFTLGTSWVYSLADSGVTVGNCHKQPASMFNRRRLSVDEATENLLRLCQSVKEVSHDTKIIFTVSPIRHTADGLHGNQLSKATLLLAIEQICSEAETNAIYFPAYEILMDDLRDYRFYAADMKHPSETAADYVYSLFSQSFFDKSTQETAGKARKLTQRMSHRLMSASQQSQIEFKNQTNRLAMQLAQDCPELKQAITKRLNIK